MSDSTTRYRKEEFQDYKGDVVYPHTSSDVVWMEDGSSVDEFVKTRASDEEIDAALID